MRVQNEQLIKKWEELRLEAYLPTPNDRWTIGWGHTHKVTKGMKITKGEAQAFFRDDIAWVEKAIDELVKVPLYQNQYDALASLIFNIGRTNFSKSTLLRKLNAKRYQEAADEFLKWKYQKGKVLRGLVRRRTEEMEYFLQAEDEGSIGAVPDEAGKAPNPVLNKEVTGGVSALLVGAGSLIGGLVPGAQLILSGALSALLVGLGAWFLISWIIERRRGDK